uniref:DUF3795 domain-containing protein n=1 Tax=Globodera pallida TaxID=36090 RepID=A0A183CCS7_GLOPA
MGETSSKPAERIRNSPPISHVLAMKGCPEVIDNLNNCLKYKKLKAIEHIGNMLSNLGLDNITRAFKKAVEENMICSCCGKQVKLIDEICYCPDSAGRCHCTGCCDTLQSPRDVLFPPISQVLNRNGCPHLMDYLNNCLKHKNTKAIEHTGTLLSDMGLDNITAAFKKAAEENMICHRCKKEIKFIDELCYCPEDSDEKCHHGTSCCDNRKIKALTSVH